MKHTKKRLLAVLLVLAMALGMAPMAALTVGAESAIVDTITVDEDRAITDLEWSTAYVSSPYNADGKAGQVVKRWSGAYRLSEIVTVPKAGTTLVWTDPASVGALGEGEFFVLGDNRTNSNDSRNYFDYYGDRNSDVDSVTYVGLVKKEQIKGVVHQYWVDKKDITTSIFGKNGIFKIFS
jgi:hypothetical protein